MGKYEKLLLKILKGKSDRNIAFNDLCQLLVSQKKLSLLMKESDELIAILVTTVKNVKQNTPKRQPK